MICYWRRYPSCAQAGTRILPVAHLDTDATIPDIIELATDDPWNWISTLQLHDTGHLENYWIAKSTQMFESNVRRIPVLGKQLSSTPFFYLK